MRSALTPWTLPGMSRTVRCAHQACRVQCGIAMRFDTPACRGGKAHSTQAGSQRRWPRPDIGQRLIESTGGAASGGPDGRAWAADCPSPGPSSWHLQRPLWQGPTSHAGRRHPWAGCCRSDSVSGCARRARRWRPVVAAGRWWAWPCPTPCCSAPRPACCCASWPSTAAGVHPCRRVRRTATRTHRTDADAMRRDGGIRGKSKRPRDEAEPQQAFGALGGTRTHDPSLRRAVLYPTELRARLQKTFLQRGSRPAAWRVAPARRGQTLRPPA